MMVPYKGSASSIWKINLQSYITMSCYCHTAILFFFYQIYCLKIFNNF